jgi:hypothetical protein
MMEAKYDKVNPVEIAKSQTHLSPSQQHALIKVLSKYYSLFDGTLGKYPHRKLHLTLQEGATPVHHKAFPVPHAHTEVFKKELQHLVKIGVLEQVGPTEWAAPTFIVSKKDGCVRWVSNFQTLLFAFLYTRHSLLETRIQFLYKKQLNNVLLYL